jgi:hypothetical protein
MMMNRVAAGIFLVRPPRDNITVRFRATLSHARKPSWLIHFPN